MAAYTKKIEEVLELTVDVAADFERSHQLKQSGLAEEDLTGLGNEAADFGFGENEDLGGLGSLGVEKLPNDFIYVQGDFS